MEKKALMLWILYCQQPQLWAGWEHAKTPIGFHDAQGAVLFGHPNPPEGFVKKEAEGVSYHVANPKPASFTANSSVDLNGVATATVMWHEREQESMLGLISHEAFHAHQMTTGCPLGKIAMAMQYPVNNPLVQALAEVEAQLLYQALVSQDSKLVTAAIDARATRQALLSKELATFEDEVELGEGLATYIEIISVGRDSKLRKAKIETLQKLNTNAWGADRLRFYYSGMAWALLCDKFAPGWQEKGWRTLADVVGDGLDYTPNPQAKDFPGFNFSKILARHQQEAVAREKDMNAQITKALPGTGLRVELHLKGNPVGGGWNPNTAVTFSGIGRFHPTGLMYTYDNGTNFKVEANCIETESCRRMIFERPDLTVLLSETPLDQGRHKGRLEITGPDCKVVIPKAQVELRGSKLRADELLD